MRAAGRSDAAVGGFPASPSRRFYRAVTGVGAIPRPQPGSAAGRFPAGRQRRGGRPCPVLLPGAGSARLLGRSAQLLGPSSVQWAMLGVRGCRPPAPASAGRVAGTLGRSLCRGADGLSVALPGKAPREWESKPPPLMKRFLFVSHPNLFPTSPPTPTPSFPRLSPLVISSLLPSSLPFPVPCGRYPLSRSPLLYKEAAAPQRRAPAAGVPGRAAMPHFYGAVNQLHMSETAHQPICLIYIQEGSSSFEV